MVNDSLPGEQPVKPHALGPRNPTDWDQLQAQLPMVDQVIRAAELRWGVGRLETLITPDTLLRWKRGFGEWREAIVAGDLDAVRVLAPKIVGALKFMQGEAERLGHKPLDPNTWEAATDDGRLFVFTRTQAEANAVAADHRDKEVWSIDEVVRILERYRQVSEIKRAFPGAAVERLTARPESFASDFAKEPYLLNALHGEAEFSK
jgi:hypothetical protein